MIWLAAWHLAFQAAALPHGCDALFARREYANAARVCATSPDLASQLLAARANAELGSLQLAISLYERYLESKPGDTPVLLELAECQVANEQSERALLVLQKVDRPSAALARMRYIANRGAAHEVHNGLTGESATKHALSGMFAFEAGQYRAAFFHYRRALALAPDFPGAHTAISEIYHRTGHPDWAEVEVQLEKNRPPQGPLKRALDYLQAAQAAEFDVSQYPSAWEREDVLGRSAQDREAWAEAAAHYRPALQSAPGTASVERRLARCLWMQGKRVEATPLLERHGMKFELAVALAEKGERERATSLLRSVMIHTPEDAKLAASAFIELNKAELALPLLQQYASMDADGSVHEVLARAYQSLHQPNPAGLAWRKAAELRTKAGAALRETEITAPAGQ